MNEEHNEDAITEESAVPEGTMTPKRGLGKWTAFIAAMIVLSGVATTGVLASNGTSGCKITDAKVAVASLFGFDSSVALAATNAEGGTRTCSKSRRRGAEEAAIGLAKAASSEAEVKSCCKTKLAKAASSEGEAKQCPKAAAAECAKAKAASSEGEAKQCPKAAAAACAKAAKAAVGTV